jgi:surface protein
VIILIILKNINYGIFIGKIIDKLRKSSNKNYIIAELYISDKDINKDIRIINSFEQAKRENTWIKNDYKKKNEKEIKENCIIKVNGMVIQFSYFLKFKNSGKYIIEYYFKHYITNTNYMFYDCSSLINLNLSNFNTTNVTDMSGMFYGCESLTNLNLSNFNTTNVTNMSYMFL